jgi:disulfide oxidoreductase YuzD
MIKPVLVQIVGSKTACSSEVRDSWRQVAEWTRSQLDTKFGESVQVRYYDLFDIDCPTLPEDASLPYIFVNGEYFSSGGKISLPALRREIETLMEKEILRSA